MILLKFEIDKSKSIYQQIINGIKKAIIKEELLPGEKIPSQRELAIELSVNPNTVQRAYMEMERLNIVEIIRGQGTFICNKEEMVEEIRKEMGGEIIESFITEMRQIGMNDDEIMEVVRKRLKQAD